MRLTKHAFFLVSFLFLSQAVFADGTMVLYFFNPPNELGEEMKTAISEVKSYWNGKVDWVEYDWSNKEHRYWFETYDIVSLPVAVVECDGQSVKVKRSADFADDLNQTIHDCYALQTPEEEEFPEFGKSPQVKKFPSDELILWTVFVICLNVVLVFWLRKRLARKKNEIMGIVRKMTSYVTINSVLTVRFKFLFKMFV